MAVHPSFSTLERAIGAHRGGSGREALALAEAAYRMLQEIPGAPPDAAIVGSWYGLFLGLYGQRLTEGMVLCAEARQAAFWDPRGYENQARLEILAGFRHRAVETLQHGLALAPDDKELVELRHSLGLRRPPVFNFLDRQNLLNRWAGLIFAR